MAVVDIDGEAAFDKTITSAGDSLVVVDYSTTWCGPCKVIAPKFDEFSEKYTDAVFLKVGVFWGVECTTGSFMWKGISGSFLSGNVTGLIQCIPFPF